MLQSSLVGLAARQGSRGRIVQVVEAVSPSASASISTSTSHNADERFPLSHYFSSKPNSSLSPALPSPSLSLPLVRTRTTWNPQHQSPHQSRGFSTMHSSMTASSSLVTSHQHFTSNNKNQRQRNPLSHNNNPLSNNNNRNHNHQQIRTKVFVSSHNDMNITSNQILEYCANRGIHNLQNARVTSTHVILQECPFCSKPTNGKADNHYKCYVNIGGGAYFCHRCGSGGSWFDFKSTLRGYQHNVVSVTGGAPASVSATDAGGGGGARNNRAAAPAHQNNSKNTGPVAPLPLPKQRLQACYISNLMDSSGNPAEAATVTAAATATGAAATGDNSNNNKDGTKALKYLQDTRGLELRTLRKYGVGKATYHFPSDESGQYVATECITFPWIMSVADVKEQEALRGAEFSLKQPDANANTVVDDSDFVTRRIKVRALEQKAWQRLDPAGGGWGLFGFHTVPEDATEIVITEGEYDAMAVWQATGRPAISLPNGCRSLPMEVLPMLEKFKKVYLWMDNDGPGQEGAKQFAKKIGLNRCYMVQPPPAASGETETCKDANEALQKGMDLESMISKASVTLHENVMDFESIRHDVIHEILNPDEYTGVPMKSLPLLTSIIKGYRRGELTILTGPTGSGKTTFLGQLSLDLAEQDVNVMWGSFEIKNTRLIQKLLQQFSRKPLPTGNPNAPALLHQLADRFSALPMHFMKFHGGSDLEDVLDAMEYAVYVSDVEHIILDNLQFMISRNSLNKSFDKYDIQDIAIEKFRKFATDRNVHISLVVHPRKEDESTKLSMSSIYGSAKATQEADTVMILQSDNSAGRHRKYIEVKKNRYDGTLGYCPLHFDRMGGRYEDTPK